MFDFILKTVAIGDEGVGKSTILSSYNFDGFFGTTEPTVGVDFFTTAVNWNKKKIKIQVWDCSGNKSYLNIISSYFKTVVAAIVFFDLSNPEEREKICEWAYHSLFPFYSMLKFDGTIPWEPDPNKALVSCPDPHNVVVFELRRDGELQSTD